MATPTTLEEDAATPTTGCFAWLAPSDATNWPAVGAAAPAWTSARPDVLTTAGWSTPAAGLNSKTPTTGRPAVERITLAAPALVSKETNRPADRERSTPVLRMRSWPAT